TAGPLPCRTDHSCLTATGICCSSMPSRYTSSSTWMRARTAASCSRLLTTICSSLHGGKVAKVSQRQSSLSRDQEHRLYSDQLPALCSALCVSPSSPIVNRDLWLHRSLYHLRLANARTPNATSMAPDRRLIHR